jgi:hypothetical protein
MSPPAFQRILVDARRSGTGVVDGAALHIEGGTFRVAAVRWHATIAAIAGRSAITGKAAGALPPATAPLFDGDTNAPGINPLTYSRVPTRRQPMRA